MNNRNLDFVVKGDSVLNSNSITTSKQAFYDHTIYPALGTTQLNLFGAVTGATVPTAFSGASTGNRSTSFDTNLSGGIIPNGQKFVANGFEIYYEVGDTPAAAGYFKAQSRGIITGDWATGLPTPPAYARYMKNTIDEIIEFYNNTMVSIKVGGALVIQQKAIHFLPEIAHRMEVALANVGTEGGVLQYLNHYIAGEPFDFGGNGIDMPPTTAVEVSLNYPQALPTLSGNNARVYSRFTGTFARAGY